MALTPQERQVVIDTLTTNCDCWKHEGDREILNSLSDDKLEHLHEDSEQHTLNSQISEFVVNGFRDDDTGTIYRINPETGNVEKALTDNRHCDDDEEDEYEEEPIPKKKGKKPTMNREMTEEEFWASAPASLKRQHKRLVANESRQRDALIESLVANIHDEDAKERQVAIYNKLSTEDLEEMSMNMPVTNRRSMDADYVDLPGERSLISGVPNYSGMGVGVTNRRGSSGEEDTAPLLPYGSDHARNGHAKD